MDFFKKNGNNLTSTVYETYLVECGGFWFYPMSADGQMTRPRFTGPDLGLIAIATWRRWVKMRLNSRATGCPSFWTFFRLFWLVRCP